MLTPFLKRDRHVSPMQQRIIQTGAKHVVIALTSNFFLQVGKCYEIINYRACKSP